MKNILMILLIFPTCLFAQGVSLDSFLIDYNKESLKLLKTIDNNQELAVSLSNLTLSLKEKHSQTVSLYKSELKKKNPDLNEPQIENEFAKQLTIEIIKYCPSFLTVNRRLMGKCTSENESLKLISNSIDDLLLDFSREPLTEQKKIADSSFLPTIKKYRKEIEKDYAGGMFDPNLIQNLGTYLIHKSNAYCRAFLAEQTIKNFE